MNEVDATQKSNLQTIVFRLTRLNKITGNYSEAWTTENLRHKVLLNNNTCFLIGTVVANDQGTCSPFSDAELTEHFDKLNPEGAVTCM